MAFALLQSGLISVDHYIAFFGQPLRALCSPLPLAGEGKGEFVARTFRHLCCLLESAAPVLAARFASELCIEKRRESEGGAGRRGPGADKFTQSAQTSDWTRGLAPLARRKRNDISRSDAVRFCEYRKSAISPASRARCLKPAPHDPRWTDLSGSAPLADRDQCLSTAAGASTCLGGWHRRYDMPPRAPSDARNGAPGPCSFGSPG
jgi:hypothetical protein